MKTSVWREHKVNMGDYESMSIGASVSFDTEVDTLPEHAVLEEHLQDLLDEQLSGAARDAVLAGTIKDSHIKSLYNIK